MSVETVDILNVLAEQVGPEDAMQSAMLLALMDTFDVAQVTLHFGDGDKVVLTKEGERWVLFKVEEEDVQ